MSGPILTRLAPGLALLAAACSSAAGSQLADVKGPMSVVAFLGKTHEKLGRVVPYLAVAASRGNELRIFDPETDAVVRSPGVAFPLSVPTLTRPLYLAAAPLSDFEVDPATGEPVVDPTTGEPIPLPDVLLVAGPGHVVQLVSTWEEPTATEPDLGMRVVAEWDLSPWAGEGAEILSMVGAPVPGTVVAPPGAVPIAPAVAGRGRVLIGFSGSSDGQGGKLVVLDFERDPNASVAGQVRLSAPPFVQHLGFDPVALSLSPDHFHLYCATLDPVTDTGGGRTVFGVGEVTMATDASFPWTVRGLDATAPTTLVASAILGERIEEVSSADPPFGAPVPRVYAALDTSGCGIDRSIACGIVTLDPVAGGLAAEIGLPGEGVPAPTYRAPMQVPGVPLAIAVAMPPLTGDAQTLSQGPTPKYPGAVEQPVQRVYPGSGPRRTTALMVVATAAGQSFILDLGRTWIPDDVAIIADASTRTKVTVALSTPGEVPTPPPPEGAGGRIVLDSLSVPPVKITDDSLLPTAIAVTPGFTRAESWEVVYQGALPNLLSRFGVISKVSGPAPWLAIQRDAATAGAPPAWVPGANLYDPRLGIHVGDVVAFTVLPATADPCPPVAPATFHEAVVADLLPPDAVNYPGGAVQLGPAGGQTEAEAFCIFGTGTSSRDTVPVVATIGASEYVLAGSVTGYAGRPAKGVEFSLAWAEEGPLLADCPLLQEPPPSPLPACDPACRAQASPPCEGGGKCYASYPDMSDPLQAGPVLRFTLDVDESAGALTPRAKLSFSTQSGIAPMSRRPSILSQGTSAISFDKSRYAGKEGLGTVFYVTYLGDLVLELPPGDPAANAGTIR
jgi:hypothetical protein